MSDDIAMEALSGPLAERARAALAAGCDIVLHCSGDAADNAVIAGALGQISDVAKARLERAMAGAATAEPADFAALVAKRDALLAYS